MAYIYNLILNFQHKSDIGIPGKAININTDNHSATVHKNTSWKHRYNINASFNREELYKSRDQYINCIGAFHNKCFKCHRRTYCGMCF